MKQEENSRQLVIGLRNLCDKVKEKVAAEETKKKKQESFDSCKSILMDTDDIPLIDDFGKTEDTISNRNSLRMRSESCSEQKAILKVPCRRSVVSCNTQPFQVPQPSLPKKNSPALLSPDVFHLRAPLVSWENFMTPTASVETLAPPLQTSSQ